MYNMVRFPERKGKYEKGGKSNETIHMVSNESYI